MSTGRAFPSVGEWDSVVGELQRRYPGLRPVGFWSPYEAAAWAILSHRVRIVQEAKIKQRLADQYGAEIELDGRRLGALPAPRVLRELRSFEGIAERKLPWLRAIADAAIECELDSALLRSLEPSEALDQLRDLPGIGPCGAELILIRGATHPDLFPTHERRLHEEIVRAYELHDRSLAMLQRIPDGWRPYRSRFERQRIAGWPRERQERRIVVAPEQRAVRAPAVARLSVRQNATAAAVEVHAATALPHPNRGASDLDQWVAGGPEW